MVRNGIFFSYLFGLSWNAHKNSTSLWLRTKIASKRFDWLVSIFLNYNLDIWCQWSLRLRFKTFRPRDKAMIVIIASLAAYPQRTINTISSFGKLLLITKALSRDFLFYEYGFDARSARSHVVRLNTRKIHFRAFSSTKASRFAIKCWELFCAPAKGLIKDLFFFNEAD